MTDDKLDVEALRILSELRAARWSVAVHNDYRLSSERHTFWLFTHPGGRWVKGEGKTDAEALAACSQASQAQHIKQLDVEALIKRENEDMPLSTEVMMTLRSQSQEIERLTAWGHEADHELSELKVEVERLKAENERLKTEATEWEETTGRISDKHGDLYAENTRLETENKRLQKAVEFYANRENWKYSLPGPAAKAADNGKMARAVLTGEDPVYSFSGTSDEWRKYHQALDLMMGALKEYAAQDIGGAAREALAQVKKMIPGAGIDRSQRQYAKLPEFK